MHFPFLPALLQNLKSFLPGKFFTASGRKIAGIGNFFKHAPIRNSHFRKCGRQADFPDKIRKRLILQSINVRPSENQPRYSPFGKSRQSAYGEFAVPHFLKHPLTLYPDPLYPALPDSAAYQLSFHFPCVLSLLPLHML